MMGGSVCVFITLTGHLSLALRRGGQGPVCLEPHKMSLGDLPDLSPPQCDVLACF